MCESTVYLASDGQEEEIMRDVVLLQPEGDALLLANLLGERKLVRGTIKKIDLLKHTVHLEKSEAPVSQ
jgi:predicted RNA-binding protein